MKDKEKPLVESESSNEPTRRVSRRDFLKYGVGVAAVAAGATALMGKIPLPAEAPKPSAINEQAGPIVVTIDGDQLTIMNGQNEVKVKDSMLAGEIASKIQ